MTLQGRSFAEQSLTELVKVADEHGAAIAGVRAKDTMKYAEAGVVEETVDREQVMDHPDAAGISICIAERSV